MPDERPLLLVIATGPQQYREYLLKSIHTRYRIHLLHIAAATWERPYIVGSTVLPSFAVDVVLAAARAVADTQPVSGVMSWDEARIIPAARVAEEFGLPGSRAEAVWRCRDKHQGRRALADAGVPQPASVLVGDVDEALAAADKLGFPVVLKPRAAAAGYGVVLAGDAEQLRARFAFAREATVPEAPRYEMPVLVEEYVGGPEVSVDSAVYRGRVLPLFLARKETGYAPYFEEVGHYTSHADALLSDPDVLRVLEGAHAALGYTDGWTHAELKLTDSGPKVIEVNGRLGGDLIPYLGMRASGIDPGLVAAAIACGTDPAPVVADRALVGGVRFFYPEYAQAVVESVTFEESALPDAVDRAVPLVAAGATVSPPPEGLVSGRVAFATAVAATERECRRALDEAQAALRVRTTRAGEAR